MKRRWLGLGLLVTPGIRPELFARVRAAAFNAELYHLPQRIQRGSAELYDWHRDGQALDQQR